MARQDRVKNRAELHDTPTGVERGHLEGNHMVVPGETELAELDVSLSHQNTSCRGAAGANKRRRAMRGYEYPMVGMSPLDRGAPARDQAPKHQARTAFWACRRFSASSNTTE